MWSANDGPYKGRHYELAETLCVPPPIQQPGPRVLIGGGGERKTLKLVARYADACNLFAPDAKVVAHKLQVLARHCDAEGRDFATIQKTIVGGVDPLRDRDAFLSAMQHYAALGIDQVWLSPRDPDPAGWVARVADSVVQPLSEM